MDEYLQSMFSQNRMKYYLYPQIYKKINEKTTANSGFSSLTKTKKAPKYTYSVYLETFHLLSDA